MWKHGFIEIPMGRGKLARCEFWAKVFDEGRGLQLGEIRRIPFVKIRIKPAYKI